MALLPGAQIELRVYEAGGSPAGATSAATTAITDGMKIILGPLYSQAVSAATPVVAGPNINVPSPSNNTTVADGYVFVLPAQVRYMSLTRWSAASQALSLPGLKDGLSALPDNDALQRFNTQYRAAFCPTAPTTGRLPSLPSGTKSSSLIQPYPAPAARASDAAGPDNTHRLPPDLIVPAEELFDGPPCVWWPRLGSTFADICRAGTAQSRAEANTLVRIGLVLIFPTGMRSYKLHSS